MPDESAFIRTILDAPDADGPRLVYADWLEERGDPRGEIIRVQIQLERWGCIPATPRWKHFCGSPRHRKYPCRVLSAREDELFDAHSELLVKSLTDLGIDVSGPNEWVGGDKRIAVFIRRGFVSSITCTWLEWLAHADKILAIQPVRKVALTTWPEAERTRPANGTHRYRFIGSEKSRTAKAIGVSDYVDVDGGTVRALLAAEWGPKYPAGWHPPMSPPIGPGVVEWVLPASVYGDIQAMVQRAAQEIVRGMPISSS